MGYAFISYNSKDQDVSDSFKALLNRNGIKTWRAPEDIPPGLSYAAVITQAIKEMSCFILLLSKNAQDSIWMPKETERAVNYEKIIIPLRLDDAPMNNDFELMLSSIQAVTVRKIDDNDEKIKNLVTRIKAYTETELLVEQKQENIDSESKAYFEKNAVMHGSTLIEFKGRDSTSVVIPEGVTDILSYAFSSSKLKNISIPSTVTKISKYAFDDCPNLQSISVSPENPIFRSENNCCIERKTNRLVLGCSKSVIPDGVITIGKHAFSHCENLTEIKIPASVATIEEGAFKLCKNLQSIQVSAQNLTYYSENNCCIEIKTHRLIIGCKNSMLPERIVSIATGAFSGCSGLIGISLPFGVVKIEESAFYDCTALHHIYIPRSVKYIGTFSFSGCCHLANIVLPNSVYYIDHWAFSRLQSLSGKRKIFCEFSRKPDGWAWNWTDDSSDVYWKDEWYYDKNGNPVVKS